MKTIHKNYEIEVCSKKNSSGQWVAEAKIIPEISAVRGITALGNPKRGFATQQQAEDAALKWAKERIDQKAG